MELEFGVAAVCAVMAKHWSCREGSAMRVEALKKQGRVMRAGATKLFIEVFPVTLALNSAPSNGQAAWTVCQPCVSLPCPSDA